jgi:hypothetical protein
MFDLKVGVWKQYETFIGRDEVGHRVEFHQELEYFDERSFKTFDDLQDYIERVYPNPERHIIFKIQAKETPS